jgi:DNA-directed RNA polymerase sigma subunit (sigma70/sigma32)
MIEQHRDLLPGVGMDQWRRIRGEQEIIARYEPERAIATLPKLLANPVERERFRALLRALMTDEQFVHRAKPNVAQLAMMETLGEALDISRERVRAAQAKLAGKPSRPPAAKRKPAKRAPAKR